MDDCADRRACMAARLGFTRAVVYSAGNGWRAGPSAWARLGVIRAVVYSAGNGLGAGPSASSGIGGGSGS